MIKAVVVFNNQGVVRFSRFYAHVSTARQQDLMQSAFLAVRRRPPNACNILEDPALFGQNIKIIYRSFATLYFIFMVDRAENELAILDLTQVFVEALDRCYKNVCELDIVFNYSTVHQALNELVLGGQVMEVTSDEVARTLQELQKLERRPDPPKTQLKARGSPLLP